MAKVRITIEDAPGGDGLINVRVESDPAFPGPAAADQSLTTAQRTGLECLHLMREGATEDQVMEDDG